ncbi:hypothetical protein OXIME_001716 [Oxyplasma meridianum]|uniref:FAD-binding oxidoreductase/transferase type 4 C-terminal domain-containing protein n=1 Tax=Oxyplasma meridianum TaxID=3073602 RepID=A0AAX4NI97_9ARCH
MNFTFMMRKCKPETLQDLRDTLTKTFIQYGGSLSHHHGLGPYLSEYLENPLKNIESEMQDPLFSKAWE